MLDLKNFLSKFIQCELKKKALFFNQKKMVENSKGANIWFMIEAMYNDEGKDVKFRLYGSAENVNELYAFYRRVPSNERSMYSINRSLKLSDEQTFVEHKF